MVAGGSTLNLAWVRAKKKFIITERLDYHRCKDLCAMYAVISSAMLQYRLCATFPLVLDCVTWPPVDRYKKVWATYLTHKASNFQVCLGDLKGAATSWPEQFVAPKTQAEKQYIEDLLELLTYLCSEQCPHTYDGCVAGSVA